MSFQTDLGCLLMCDSCIAWFNCGTPASESRACLDRLLGSYFWYWAALPSLNTKGGGGGGLVLPQLDMPCFFDTHGSYVSF